MNTRLVLRFEQLTQRLLLNPMSHWVGLYFEPKTQLLTAVFVGAEQSSELMPWHAMVTKGPWDSSDEGEEYFLEALSIENLLERLGRFIEAQDLVFFEVPNSVEMDVICHYPDKMFLALFSELVVEEGGDIKQAAVELLTVLNKNAK